MTEEILSLVRSKNRCLERLMEVTQSFLQCPFEKMTEGNEGCSALDIYDRERVSVIRTLELYDRKLNELIAILTPELKTQEFITAVKIEMQKNERLLTSVFNADDIVFRRISEARERVAQQLIENRKSKDTLNKFKSTWISESGEGVDQTL